MAAAKGNTAISRTSAVLRSITQFLPTLLLLYLERRQDGDEVSVYQIELLNGELVQFQEQNDKTQPWLYSYLGRSYIQLKLSPTRREETIQLRTYARS